MTITGFILRLFGTAYVLYTIYDGRTWVDMRVSQDSIHTCPQPIDRDESPFFFWLYSGLKCLCVAAVWLL